MRGKSWPLLPPQMILRGPNLPSLRHPMCRTGQLPLPEGRHSSHPFRNGSTLMVLITSVPFGGPFLPSKRLSPGCDQQPLSRPALLRPGSPSRSPRWVSLSICQTVPPGDLVTPNGMWQYAFLIHRASAMLRIPMAPQEYSCAVFAAMDMYCRASCPQVPGVHYAGDPRARCARSVCRVFT